MAQCCLAAVEGDAGRASARRAGLMQWKEQARCAFPVAAVAGGRCPRTNGQSHPHPPSVPFLLPAHVSPAAANCQLPTAYRQPDFCVIAALSLACTRPSALPCPLSRPLRTCNLSQPSSAHVLCPIWGASRRPLTFASRAFSQHKRAKRYIRGPASWHPPRHSQTSRDRLLPPKNNHLWHADLLAACACCWFLSW